MVIFHLLYIDHKYMENVVSIFVSTESDGSKILDGHHRSQKIE